MSSAGCVAGMLPPKLHVCRRCHCPLWPEHRHSLNEQITTWKVSRRKQQQVRRRTGVPEPNRVKCSAGSPPHVQQQHVQQQQQRPAQANGETNTEHNLSRSTARGHVAFLKASKVASLTVVEAERRLDEYLQLPASQYSVLDAERVERIDDNTFRCYVGALSFFSWRVEPVLTVSVTVGPKGPTVRLLSTKLEGSAAAHAANDRFTATMTNVVRWDMAEGGEGASLPTKQLSSDTSIQVALEVPFVFRVIPLRALEGTGSAVLQRVLNTLVPRFLKQLDTDYRLWASGDESRKPIGCGQLGVELQD